MIEFQLVSVALGAVSVSTAVWYRYHRPSLVYHAGDSWFICSTYFTQISQIVFFPAETGNQPCECASARFPDSLRDVVVGVECDLRSWVGGATGEGRRGGSSGAMRSVRPSVQNVDSLGALNTRRAWCPSTLEQGSISPRWLDVGHRLISDR